MKLLAQPPERCPSGASSALRPTPPAGRQRPKAHPALPPALTLTASRARRRPAPPLDEITCSLGRAVPFGRVQRVAPHTPSGPAAPKSAPAPTAPPDAPGQPGQKKARPAARLKSLTHTAIAAPFGKCLCALRPNQSSGPLRGVSMRVAPLTINKVPFGRVSIGEFPKPPWYAPLRSALPR